MEEYAVRAQVPLAGLALLRDERDGSGGFRQIEACDCRILVSVDPPKRRQVTENVESHQRGLARRNIPHTARFTDRGVESLQCLGIAVQLGRFLVGINDEMLGPGLMP